MPSAAGGTKLSREHWNKLAAQFNSSVCDITAGERGQVLKTLVDEALARNPRPVVIDLGCGVGTFIRRYGRRFGETVGVDFAERMLRGARRRCAKVPRVRWVCASVEEAPSKVGLKADFSVCLNVLTSPDAALRRRQWKALATLTKPGGCTLVALPSFESAKLVADVDEKLNPGSSAQRYADGSVNRGEARQKHYTRQELRAAAERAGFRALRLVKVNYTWRDEGIDPRAAAKASRGRYPWDWVLLAARGHGPVPER